MEILLKFIVAAFGVLVISRYTNYLLRELIVHTASLIMIIYYVTRMKEGGMNGDNITGADDKVNYSCFKYINEKILGAKVFFPLDMSNSKDSMKEGTLKNIGIETRGKYAGKAVGMIESNSRFYLCPADRIYTKHPVKELDNEVIAQTEDKLIKFCNWESGKYKGYFHIVSL
jgi:hypothetical protein